MAVIRKGISSLGQISSIDVETVTTAPLIKWPGGKRSLIPQLLPYVPRQFGTYFEPFFGGGALFFALAPKAAVLSDLNSELISCYQAVQDDPKNLIKALRRLENTEDEYYRVRGSNPRTQLSRAARLLYLTRLSFNGIHRVNLRGEFNVPYGRKVHLSSVDEELLLNTSKALQVAKLKHGDFEAATKTAKDGDFVYFDPPYTVAHANNGFVKYNERIFSWADQIRLAEHARRLRDRGCYVLISNADHPSITDLYRGHKHVVIERHSVIAASREHRRKITESIIVLGGEQS